MFQNIHIQFLHHPQNDPHALHEPVHRNTQHPVRSSPVRDIQNRLARLILCLGFFRGVHQFQVPLDELRQLGVDFEAAERGGGETVRGKGKRDFPGEC